VYGTDEDALLASECSSIGPVGNQRHGRHPLAPDLWVSGIRPDAGAGPSGQDRSRVEDDGRLPDPQPRPPAPMNTCRRSRSKASTACFFTRSSARRER